MRRGTTPTFDITCDVDLTGFTIYVTLKQGAKEFTFTPSVEATETGCTLSITLTQEQTLALNEKVKTAMQVRAIDAAGLAIASNIMAVDVGMILREGVISYGA